MFLACFHAPTIANGLQQFCWKVHRKKRACNVHMPHLWLCKLPQQLVFLLARHHPLVQHCSGSKRMSMSVCPKSVCRNDRKRMPGCVLAAPSMHPVPQAHARRSPNPACVLKHIGLRRACLAVPRIASELRPAILRDFGCCIWNMYVRGTSTRLSSIPVSIASGEEPISLA